MGKILIVSPSLYNTGQNTHPDHTLDACIHICHQIHGGHIPFLHSRGKYNPGRLDKSHDH